jgi:hypothetical protein
LSVIVAHRRRQCGPRHRTPRHRDSPRTLTLARREATPDAVLARLGGLKGEGQGIRRGRQSWRRSPSPDWQGEPSLAGRKPVGLLNLHVRASSIGMAGHVDPLRVRVIFLAKHSRIRLGVRGTISAYLFPAFKSGLWMTIDEQMLPAVRKHPGSDQ